MTRGRGRGSAGRAGKSSVRQHKRLAVEKGRDPTPSEKHLHVHTHGHAGKSFVGEQSRIVHEQSQEISHQQTQAHSDNDESPAYYQAAGGEKKRRVYDLESHTKCYYGPNLRASSGSDATSPATHLNVQLPPIENLDEFVKRLIPKLMDHMLPILVEGVRRAISSPSHQSNTRTDHPLVVAPIVPAAPTAANIDEVHASVSDDD